MSDKTDTQSQTAPSGGILDNLKVGLKVLFDELKWTVSKMVRGYEIKQMNRRLEKEYALLGKLARQRMDSGDKKAAMPRDGEAGIILSQIEFLEQEMEFLSKDIDTSREQDIQRRTSELGLNDED
ncbi:hypothetical protein [Desulfovibrio ferrophilus]|uniref:Uncharacterized protein n=1 Tax=Desulfovibrio ferrophilus TaxID=241368 RepID=A0A2Z6AXF1_9BACT|nr:hypothetical protein [Desulfovibrio ferrophilus]BBD07873.1 uncharacterized protein DFE_1147 [Desulfovibrio ferrophilus]